MVKDDKPVALVTGAGRGIGRAIALGLASAGFHVAGISRGMDPEGAAGETAALKEAMEAAGVHFLPLRADVSRIERHDALVAEIEGRLGPVDLLVNNAGVAPLERLDILETSPKSYDHVLGINLRGTFFFTQAVARRMTAGSAGSGGPDAHGGFRRKIIFITSVSAEVSSTSRAEYCISKAGLSMAARVFADRLAGEGIGVYEIRPGLVETEMTAPVKARYDALIAGGLVPMGRWGRPEDVAAAVTAIAEGRFDYTTGAVFELSGGMNIRSL